MCPSMTNGSTGTQHSTAHAAPAVTDACVWPCCCLIQDYLGFATYPPRQSQCMSSVSVWNILGVIVCRRANSGAAVSGLHHRGPSLAVQSCACTSSLGLKTPQTGRRSNTRYTSSTIHTIHYDVVWCLNGCLTLRSSPLCTFDLVASDTLERYTETVNADASENIWPVCLSQSTLHAAISGAEM